MPLKGNMKVIHTGFDAADAAVRRHGGGFITPTAFRSAVRRELEAAGLMAYRAIYDNAGNCRVCGESGRCPGWHTTTEIDAAATY